MGQDKIRRASKNRIREAQSTIASAIDQGVLPRLGDMTMTYFARHIAKRAPVAVNELALPQTATTRQIQHLDKEREDLIQRTAARDNDQHSENVTLEITVNRSKLRKALGLPDMNLDGVVNFQDPDNLSDPSSDLEDIDHDED